MLQKVLKIPEQGDELACDWTPERMLEMIMKGKKIVKENWVDEGLPNLVDKIMENYERYGGIDHLDGEDVPSKQVVIAVLQDMFAILFPGYVGKVEMTKINTRSILSETLHSTYVRLVRELERSLKYICRKVEKCPVDVCFGRAEVVAKEFLENIPEFRILLRGDIQAAYDGDPAAESIDEVILSYPCVLAIATYRMAHELYIRGIPLVPRIMSEYAHSVTGIDIHPGAKIGKNFFIDHGTGVVIGETAKIGDNVKIYQGVTLGALSFPKDEKGQVVKGRRRHPTVGNNVVIYSGATLLGEKAIIEDDAVIGGNVWITSSIPSGTTVTIAPPELKYKKNSRQL